MARITTLEDLRSDVTTQNLVADVFLVATLASGAATAVFYFTRPEVESERTSWMIVPSAGPQGGGVSFTASRNTERQPRDAYQSSCLAANEENQTQ